MPHRAVAALIAVAACSVVTAGAAPAEAPALPEAVIFAEEGPSDLHVLARDGEVRRVRVPGGESSPLPSANGRWVAFERSAGASTIDLLVMRRDGSGIRRVSREPRTFVWHPGSLTLVFDAADANEK